MSLQPITRGLHEASHLWHAVNDGDDGRQDVDESGAVMCTTPLQDERTAATLFQDLSDPASVSCSQVEQKEKVYCCLVRGCKKRFRAQNERKQHQRATHHFTPEFNLDKMHLQPIKARNRDKIGGVDEVQMSDDEEIDDVQLKQAFPVGYMDPDPHEEGKLVIDNVQEADLTKAMANLTTTHFVPRSVQMRGAK